jgi:hypothetical protein
MRDPKRRIGAFEQWVRPQVPDQDELYHVAPRHLSFEEICYGQAALEGFGGNPLAAVEVNDPTMTALVAVAPFGAAASWSRCPK